MRTVIPVVGAAVGLALALFGVLQPSVEVGGEVVAVIDGRRIERNALERAARAVAEDLGVEADRELRRQVLERMIDEELLVAHALELGVAERDPLLRTKMGRAVIDLVTSTVVEPNASELAAFYEEHAELFREQPRVAVRVARFTGPERKLRARDAKNCSWTDVSNRADEVVFVPDGTMPVTKLSDYTGTVVSRAAAEGLGAHVVHDGGRSYVVAVTEFVPGEIPSLETIEGQVAARLRSRRGDEALRRYLEDARRGASVTIIPELQ